MIKKSVNRLRDSILDTTEPKVPLSGMSIASSSPTSASPYMSNSDTDISDSRRSSVVRYNINNHDPHYCSNSDRTSDSRNQHSMDECITTPRSNDDRQDTMPISSILSGVSPLSKATHLPKQQKLQETHRRLPPIDVVRTEPLLSTDPPSTHYLLSHQLQDFHRGHPFSSPSLSSTTSATSLSPSSKPLCISSSSAMDLDRSVPPLKPLRPIQSLLESNGDLDGKDKRLQKKTLDLLSSKETRSSSAYMRLGKESPLLNPPLQDELPHFNYGNSLSRALTSISLLPFCIDSTTDKKRGRPNHPLEPRNS